MVDWDGVTGWTVSGEPVALHPVQQEMVRRLLEGEALAQVIVVHGRGAGVTTALVTAERLIREEGD